MNTCQIPANLAIVRLPLTTSAQTNNWNHIYHAHATRMILAGKSPMPRIKFDYITNNGSRHYNLLDGQDNYARMIAKQAGANHRYADLI